MGVKVTIILARVKARLVGFPYKEEGGSLGRVGGSDVAFSQVFVEELFEFGILCRRELIAFWVLRDKGFVEFNGVIPFFGGGESLGGLLVENLEEVVVRGGE